MHSPRTLDGTRFDGAVLVQATVTGVALRASAGGLPVSMIGARLENATFTGVSFAGVALSGAHVAVPVPGGGDGDGGVPLFAVCLGAQTLAHALGGRVGPAPQQLAGFYLTELTEAGMADAVLGSLPRRFDAFNANGYAFELPAGAIDLARGPVPQGFRAGRRAWGVQFHPEVRAEQVRRWWEDERDELPRPLAELEAELDAKLGRWQELGRRLCRAFLAAAGR
jgi:GMP synthase (glutamine-hydrolysing)